ncbi:MAG: hypothetical protein JXR68_14165 [Bacteroidales bacterium]|nr:hypothetical protein [Bacteroidales bacterium]
MPNKYNYFAVIQQKAGSSFEDVEVFEVNSKYCFKEQNEYEDFKYLKKEYKLMGYPIRVIHRKKQKTKNK